MAINDGLNFLRIGYAAPFTAIKYWEVGNEEYGSWETDHHGTAGPGGVSTGAQHDPATYVAFAKQFADLAAQILAAAGQPAISFGIDSGDPTGNSDNKWTRNVLTIGLADGFVPAFISDHSYMQAPSSENDSYLLNSTVSDANSDLDWSTRYGLYQSLLQQTLAGQASDVTIMATEFNSVYASPGKQSTSLVNGLFIANSLGSLLTSGYSAGYVWDLRNGWGTGDNNSNSLYGWREGGDYGVLGPAGQNDPPYANTYIAYPSYYALQLASKIIVAGGEVVSATSNYGDLDVYAVKQANGDLDLLVINTDPAAAINSQFSVTGIQPTGAAQVWQYGKAEDLAQSLTTNGASMLTHTSASLTVNGTNFSYAFPAYSMTVLDLTGSQTLTSIVVALAANNLATTGAEQFTSTAFDQFDDPLVNQPVFTWSVSGGGTIDSSGNYQPPYTTGSAKVEATAGTVMGQATVSCPGLAQWASSGGGSWTSGNWTGTVSTTAVSPPGVRSLNGDIAQFASAGGVITLDGVNPDLAGISFTGSSSYTLAAGSGGNIQLDNGGSPATINVSSGSHTISAPVTLKSSAEISVAEGDRLTIGGALSGSNTSLNVNGPGRLVLSGKNNFGATTVSSGTLIATSTAALPAGTTLTVGAGGTFIFDPSIAGSNAVTAVATIPVAKSAGTVSDTTVNTSKNRPTLITLSVMRGIGVPGLFPRSGAVFGDRLTADSKASGTNADVVSVERISRQAIDAVLAGQDAGAIAWLGFHTSSSWSDNQDQKRDIPTQFLDAVFTRYRM